MSQPEPELVDAEVVEHRFVGQDFVIVRLPDGVECKITLVVVASRVKDQKNPDGTPIFNLTASPMFSFKQPVGKVIKVPKPQISPRTKPQDRRITA